jgi:ubiquinone/menaquinone biosynthesis C-methylase UbiE
MRNREKELYNEYWVDRAGRTGDRCGYAPNLRRWMKGVLQGRDRGQRLLEVGCGDCQFTPDLKEFSDHISAIDISSHQIEINTKTHTDIEFLQHDLAQPLPFETGTFGAIWCSEVVEHLSQPKFALDEFFRVLNPGGQLLLTVPHHGRFKNVLIALFKWEAHFDPEYPHLQYFTDRSLRKLVARTGFEEMETATCGMNRVLRDLIIPTNILLTARKPAAEPPDSHV